MRCSVRIIWNGNLANDGVQTYQWDALNRLKQVNKAPSSPVLIGTYTYDALGRRIRKVITNDGLSGNITNGTFDYLYHGGFAQCCEERDGSNNPQKQYVWGHYIDELLQQKVDISGTPADEYPLQDLLYRTLALTDASGDIIETYDYDAYGNTLIFTAAGTGTNWWADDATQGDSPSCEFLFTGRRYDDESAIYFYRARYYVPGLGRFATRDPLGYPDGPNAYQAYFVPNGLDPFGLEFIGSEELVEHINRPLDLLGIGKPMPATVLGQTSSELIIEAKCVPCECSDKWRITLTDFRVEAHSTVRTKYYFLWVERRAGLFNKRKWYQGYYEYRIDMDMVQDTLHHEGLHREAFQDFHNRIEHDVETKLNSDCEYDNEQICNQRKDRLIAEWNAGFAKVRRAEAMHAARYFASHREKLEQNRKLVREIEKTEGRMPYGLEFGVKPHW